ncbi:uncharacterized protein Tco025E_07413 [Trypanosoma conorhini]|uniref:Uncharacterized protein n=1 Tax=Trypanosoma conorhini TaxID=83891 RepID=A0A3R7M1D0_9TRYP|nr:uncharacterized protein Tco025E_07413 [Trypanosoma conorhini]RNF07240.1 hypothetical protein Tco025E_07413 [Trypanosoma conorhini]
MGSGTSKGAEPRAAPRCTAACDTAGCSRSHSHDRDSICSHDRESSRSRSRESSRSRSRSQERGKEEASAKKKSEFYPQPIFVLRTAPSPLAPLKPAPNECFTGSFQCLNENNWAQRAAPLREVEESFPSDANMHEEAAVNTQQCSPPLPLWGRPTSRSDICSCEVDDNEASSSTQPLAVDEKKRSMLSRSSRSHSHEFRRSGTRVLMKSSTAIAPAHHNNQIDSVPSILRRVSGVGRTRSERNLPAFASREEGWNEEDDDSFFTTAFSLDGSRVEAVSLEDVDESEQGELRRVVALVKEMREYRSKMALAAAPA